MKRKILLPCIFSLLLLAGVPQAAVCAPAASEEATESAMPASQSDPEKVKTWAASDPYGVSMSLLAMLIVFCSLIVLYVFFRAIGKTLGRSSEQPAPQVEEPAAAPEPLTGGDEAEVAAAIAMALQQALYQHDEESGIITLKPHSSAWNLKNYTLTMNPEA